ncbi:MAG: RHS repeat-associated core domain-containing protein [Candidatus Obscuribacterales bacterium]|jgi:RHS repeat-associated protein
MTSDGTNSYTWDAENRLIKITYPGSGNFSEILYDANGIKGQITETVSSTLTSTKQFVNSGTRICEERDASGAVAKKFLGRGQTISGSNYFYDLDHLGSIRDMTDSSGVVQAHYEYDLYGQSTKTAGALDSDFQYAGYYMHTPSDLNLTVYRAYSPLQGRWINRDPILENGFDARSSMGELGNSPRADFLSLPQSQTMPLFNEPNSVSQASWLQQIENKKTGTNTTIGLDPEINSFTYVDQNPIGKTDPSGLGFPDKISKAGLCHLRCLNKAVAAHLKCIMSGKPIPVCAIVYTITYGGCFAKCMCEKGLPG